MNDESKTHFNNIFHLFFRNHFKVSEGGSSTTKSTISTNAGSTFSEKQFEVDHSFLFLVWDYYSGMLLLMGRVTNPLLGQITNQSIEFDVQIYFGGRSQTTLIKVYPLLSTYPPPCRHCTLLVLIDFCPLLICLIKIEAFCTKK